MEPAPARDVRPGWYAISVRPQGQHEALRRRVVALGGRLLACSPARLEPLSCPALAQALAADIVVFTSPAAVRFATREQPLSPRRGQLHLGVGSGTAGALRRAGVPAPRHPARMQAEGLLALPELQRVAGRSIGLVTAPGGRGVIAPALRERGARLRLAEVYARRPRSLDARERRALQATGDGAGVLVLSSGELFDTLWGQLRPVDRERLRRLPAVVPGERLADRLRACGFQVRVAAGPGAGPMAQAARHAVDHAFG